MLPHLRGFPRLLLVVMFALVFVLPVQAKGTAYRTGFHRWRAADNGFAAWQLGAGSTRNADGALIIDSAKAVAKIDELGEYNGGSYFVGEATSPIVEASFGFTEAIASWNADTPDGTWIETLVSARIGSSWTKWYNLGVWAATSSTIKRHSVSLQGDANGYVAVDTLVLSAKKSAATAFQVKMRLFAKDATVTPTLRNVSIAYSTTPTKPGTFTQGNSSLWGKTLAVPECSQMVYPEGGEVWCSPTSTSMVLAYWSNATANTVDCETRVRAAVDGVYDWSYDGHGNWPFNTAYAAIKGHEGYVARFTTLAQAETWIAAGVPVVVSFAWGKGDLTGAAIPSSAGHLAVLVGFDVDGNPIINDPAAGRDADVQRAYNRLEFESLWLEHSGGAVYLIYPAGHPVPQL